MTYEENYLNLCRKILEEGVWVNNERTGVECLTIPNYTFTIEDEIPLLTTRPSYPVSAWAELVGYQRRYEWATQFDNIGAKTWYTNSNETEAWLKNSNRRGVNHIGKCYGAALYDFELPELFEKLNKHYDDRGLIINFWKPEKFHLGCLRPCLFQHIFTILDGKLYLKSDQRSCDVMCGLNFNSISVFMLLKHYCKITGLKYGGVTHTIVNPHIYKPHLEGVKELLKRLPSKLEVDFKVNDWVKSFEDIVNTDAHARDYFTLTGYKPQGKIDFELIA